MSVRDEPRGSDGSGGDGDDALVDLCLQEMLGNRRSPDLATRIAMATERERSAAAAAVDAAADAATDRRRRASTRWMLVAAAAVMIIACGWAFFAAAAVPPTSTQDQARLLLDRFHAAMPRDPAQLRESDGRAEVAAASIPVIRSIVALHAADPTETVFGARVVEFEIYGVVLGDDELRTGLMRRAARGDAVATGALLVVDAILGSIEARSHVLADLGPAMVAAGGAGESLAWCLAIADLSSAELEVVAGALDEPQLERALRRGVELAARSPRRWLGQQLELFGRLVDDRLFSTAELVGRPVLVCFWASWCPPSLDMCTRLRAVQQRHPEVAVVGVSCDHDAVALRRALAGAGEDAWIHFHDAARPGWHELAARCDIGLLPTVLVLDRAGIVRGVTVGLADVAGIEGALRR